VLFQRFDLPNSGAFDFSGRIDIFNPNKPFATPRTDIQKTAQCCDQGAEMKIARRRGRESADGL